MKKYKSEAAFGKDVSDAFKRLMAAHVTRIETGGTSDGVPDMFVSARGNDMWLELKWMPKAELLKLKEVEGKKVKVAWRPGQQAWARMYWAKHKCGKRVATLIAFKDCYAVWFMGSVVPGKQVDAKALSDFPDIASAVSCAWEGNFNG